MRYIYTYILFYLFYAANAQIRFNTNLLVGCDTALDIGNSVIEARNGKIISCGTLSNYFSTYSAAYIVKTKFNGDTLWRKQFNFSGKGINSFTDLKELPDSNYLLVGTTYDSIIQNTDVFLAKIDTSGNLIWFKKYTHIDYDKSAELKLTADSKVIIVGNSSPDPNTTYNDALLIKTDLNGNLIWRKRFGNTYDEGYNSIEIIKNNTEYLLGGSYGYYNTGNPYYDVSLMRTDTAGNVIWQQQYGTPAHEAGGIAVNTLDSGITICGTYNNTGALLKTNKAGIVQWIKNYGLPANSYIRQVKQLEDSTFVMITSVTYTPTNSYTGFLIKTDKNGNLLWQRVYPGPTTIPNYFFGFNTTADKGFIMTGQYNHIGQPYQNMWLVKTDSLGCDSVSCSYLVTEVKETSINANTNNFSIYPNPNTGNFKIQFGEIDDEENSIEITIVNVIGQTLFTKTITNTKELSYEIQCNNLSKGVYITTLIQNQKILGQSKLIIE